MLSSALALCCIGCSRVKLPAKTVNLINRTFEDLTLGMTEKEFKSKLVYEELSQNSAADDKQYRVYSVVYNNAGIKPKMNEVDNVLDVNCSFFEGKLYEIFITYKVDYNPSWDSFIYNTQQKYGKETDLINSVMWDDGITRLFMYRAVYAEQYLSYRVTKRGYYYKVMYLDNELDARKKEQERKEAPSF